MLFGAADGVFRLIVGAAIFSSRDFLGVGGGVPGGGDGETGTAPLGERARLFLPDKALAWPPPSAAAAAAAAVAAASTVSA